MTKTKIALLSMIVTLAIVLSSASFLTDDDASSNDSSKFGYGTGDGIETAYYEDDVKGLNIIWIHLTEPVVIAGDFALVIDGQIYMSIPCEEEQFVAIPDALDAGEHTLTLRDAFFTTTISCKLYIGSMPTHVDITGSGSVYVGYTTKLSYKLMPESKTQLCKGVEVIEWSSDSAEIATVSDTGLVGGVSVGSATITLTYKIDYGFMKSDVMSATKSVTVSKTPVPPGPDPPTPVPDPTPIDIDDDGTVTEEAKWETKDSQGNKVEHTKDIITETDNTVTTIVSEKTIYNDGSSSTKTTVEKKDPSGYTTGTEVISSSEKTEGNVTTTNEKKDVYDKDGALVESTKSKTTAVKESEDRTVESTEYTVYDDKTKVIEKGTQTVVTDKESGKTTIETNTKVETESTKTEYRDVTTEWNEEQDKKIHSESSTVVKTENDEFITKTQEVTDTTTREIGGVEEKEMVTNQTYLDKNDSVLRNIETTSEVSKAASTKAGAVIEKTSKDVVTGKTKEELISTTTTESTITAETNGNKRTYFESVTEFEDRTISNIEVTGLELTTYDNNLCITTVATETVTGGVKENYAETTLNYKGDGADIVLSNEDIERSYAHSVKTTEELGVAGDFDRSININSNKEPVVAIAADALKDMASEGKQLGLKIYGESGTLVYDKTAIKTIASEGQKVKFSMKKDDKSSLTDEQKKTIGDGTFVSVLAQTSNERISDLNGGTVTMTFKFTNPKEWKDFAAYYVEDNGNKEEMGWEYDEILMDFTVTSKHLSVYAVLEKTNPGPAPGSDNALIYIVIAIVVILLIVAIAVYYFMMHNNREDEY